MYDSLIVTFILFCSIYECYILRKEYLYDANKDAVKRERKTRTTKKVTTTPTGETVTEEETTTTEQGGKKQSE